MNKEKTPIFWIIIFGLAVFSGWLLYIGDFTQGITGLIFILIVLFVPRWAFAVLGFWFMVYAVFLMHTTGYKWNHELGFFIGAIMLHLGIERAYKRP